MRSVVVTSTLSLLLLGFFVAGVEGAAACGNGKLILEDKFETLAPVWGFVKQDDARTNRPEGLTYKLAPLAPNTDVRGQLNQSDFYDNYEVCAMFTTRATKDATVLVSVVFWATDVNNYYAVSLSPTAGKYMIARTKNGKTLYQVPAAEDSSVVKGTSATNEVSIRVNGKNATLFINGKKVIDDFIGTPPEGGSLFGFQMATDNPATITLKSIQLREVETEQQSSQTSQQPSTIAQQPATPSVQPPSSEGEQQSSQTSQQPSTTAQPPATPSGKPPRTETPQPQLPSATAQQPATLSSQPPSGPSSAAAAKPMPSFEGVMVALGDPRDSVRQAYSAATETGAGDLVIAPDGIKFFFTKDHVLREIMVEAPFKGSVDGIKIGDTAEDVVARRGQPDNITQVYGGSGYLYYAGGNILRYDVDEKSKKVTDIVQILSMTSGKK